MTPLPPEVREKLREAIYVPLRLCVVTPADSTREAFSDAIIDAVLLALSESGRVVVPGEPSEWMLHQGYKTTMQDAPNVSMVRAIYANMIAASEKP